VLLLALQLRDARATWRIALALACAVLITAALVTLLEGALTLFHLVALLLVVGIGSNYALFFGLPQAECDDIAVPASVLLCMASTLIAFALLAASRTPVLHMIGLTAAIGAAVSMIAAVAVAQPANERP
jgi:predicted exporter